MTEVVFTERGGKLTGFEVSGHTGLFEAGKDILCAAVSSAVYLTANTITDVLHIPAEVAVDDASMRLTLPDAFADQAEAVMQGLRLHLRELSRQYHRNLIVINRRCQ